MNLLKSLASLVAIATERELAQKQAQSEQWRGLGGQRSSLKVRRQTPPKYKQGARECARRLRQTAAKGK